MLFLFDNRQRTTDESLSLAVVLTTTLLSFCLLSVVCCLLSKKKRKQLAYKPGSVLLHFCFRANVVQRLSFICAYCCQQTIAVYPPARASSPQAPVYMTLQLPERTAQDVTIPTGGLLPHLLTLTSSERGGYSLLRQPCRHRHLAH